MAAASAGSYQSDVPSMVTPSVMLEDKATLESHLHSVQSQTNSLLQLQQQQRQLIAQHQPTVQFQMQKLLAHQSHVDNLQTIQGRLDLQPRVGSGSHKIQMPGYAMSTAGNVFSGNQPRQPNKNMSTHTANIPAGWRRLLTNKEIIYISPSGATLRNHEQIKDYLLSPGTCKCGLPCPFRPEYFFDFNSQVPNIPLKPPLENGHPPSSLACLHQKRLFDNLQDILIVKDIKRRKLSHNQTAQSDTPHPPKSVSCWMPTRDNNFKSSHSVEIESLASETVNNIPNNKGTSSEHRHVVLEHEVEEVSENKVIGNVSISKTPPWRKNLSNAEIPQEHAISQHPSYAESNERVPPLPPTHMENLSVPNHPPWQHDQTNPRFRARTGAGNGKRTQQPNFKDDPTGYLNQQTAILHNSIMNVVKDPQMEEENCHLDGSRNKLFVKNDNNINQSVIQQQMHIDSAPIYPTEVDNKQSSVYHHNIATTPQIISNQNYHQYSQQPHAQQQSQEVRTSQIQNRFSSIKKQEQQDELRTTSIGGQTVTHFPNGLVKIEQNCDTNVTTTPLKPQQQIQLQQQIQQHNILYRQNQQIQKITGKGAVRGSGIEFQNAAKPQGSPVSSSTTFRRIVAPTKYQQFQPEEHKRPAQVGSISTSHESPRPCSPSPAESIESSNSLKTASSPSHSNMIRVSSFATHTVARNTVTSVTSGKPATATTTASDKPHQQNQKVSLANMQSVPMQSVLSSESSNQIVMTSTGQIIVMPNNSQVIKASGSNQNIIHHSMNTHASDSGERMAIMNQCQGTQATNSGLVIQSAVNHAAMQSSNNFIVNSQTTSSRMQPTTVILNNGHNLLTKANNGTKVISNNQMGLISPNSNNIIGQQAVVLNTLSNGYVIQPNFTAATTVDGHVVSQLVSQDNSGASFLPQQQTQKHIIISSPDSRRRPKKRKSSSSSSSTPSTPSMSPHQSPTMHQQQSSRQVVQIGGPQYTSQGFQLSPGIQGIVVNKNTQQTAPQQQILFQNSQIMQPMNILGQQLLVPAGLMMAPETTLLQIQNVSACGSIITPQGMVLRTQSPHNKNFISTGAGGQQFIVGSNGQLSPINQIYSTPMGLMMPSQANTASTTFVQQNAAIVQQQHRQHVQATGHIQQHHERPGDVGNTNERRSSVSPPDTTTHSPRSPERPLSQRSGGSDMVQCVSSSEPDSLISSHIADSAQSPSTTDSDSGIPYQQTNIHKSSEVKIRRVQTMQQCPSTQDIMKPDSYESSVYCRPSRASTTPTTTASSMGCKSLEKSNVMKNNLKDCTTIVTPCGGGHHQVQNVQQQPQTSSSPLFSIGELVWGAARGHPAWPGKVVYPPEGIGTPSDSTWVQWFGGRPNVELVVTCMLKTLSEGLDAHHKAQKDTRKSRKLNSQLERAIQEAMLELDRTSSSQPSSSTIFNSNTTKSRGRGGKSSTAQCLGQQRSKLIKIAPAPPSSNSSHKTLYQLSSLGQNPETYHAHTAK